LFLAQAAPLGGDVMEFANFNDWMYFDFSSADYVPFPEGLMTDLFVLFIGCLGFGFLFATFLHILSFGVFKAFSLINTIKNN
jgi:hypothetical protein